MVCQWDVASGATKERKWSEEKLTVPLSVLLALRSVPGLMGLRAAVVAGLHSSFCSRCWGGITWRATETLRCVVLCGVVTVHVCNELRTCLQAGTCSLAPRRLSHRGESLLQARLSRTCSSTWFRCFTTSRKRPCSERTSTSITWRHTLTKASPFDIATVAASQFRVCVLGSTQFEVADVISLRKVCSNWLYIEVYSKCHKTQFICKYNAYKTAKKCPLSYVIYIRGTL